jgi:hypothetical protein
MAVVKNATGWVPSQLAYLSRGSGGYVPFSNYGNLYWQARAISQWTSLPLAEGISQVVAGPELDQMQPIGDTWDFSWMHDSDPTWDGYFDMPDQYVPTVSPGQTVYYQVNLTYPVWYGLYTQPSRTLKLVAGGGVYPVPSAADIRFPSWPEWPEPVWLNGESTATNQVRIPNESVSFTNIYWAYKDFGIPTAQWRKNGNIIPGATNFVYLDPIFQPGGRYQSVLTITNVQAADAGVYDIAVYGNRSMIDPEISLAVQIMNGSGFFQSPYFIDTNFVCGLLGAAGRSYEIQWSTNLSSWTVLQTLANVTGTLTFTNSLSADVARFYRARLLP